MFSVLNLHAIADRHEEIPLGSGRVQVRAPGDLLFPAFQSTDDLDRLRLDMGNSVFSAQYPQNPTPPVGHRLRRDWFKTYDFEPRRIDFNYLVQSWDTGQSELPTSSYSVCTTWRLSEDVWHLIDFYRSLIVDSTIGIARSFRLVLKIDSASTLARPRCKLGCI